MAAGDLIASLPGFKHRFEETGEKVLIYQQLNAESHYYDNAIYTTLKDGVPVLMNEELFNMVRPLLQAQEYVEDFRIWQGEPVDADFDQLLIQGRCNKPYGQIQRWAFYIFPNLACDLSVPWLRLPSIPIGISKTMTGKILINRTERWKNPRMSYFFLKEYGDNVIFTGTEREHSKFCEEWKLNIPRLFLSNFLELAQAISTCKVFVGSQSSAWNIAEALKVPRIVEICAGAPNCIPIGPNGNDALNQVGMEYWVKTLFNK